MNRAAGDDVRFCPRHKFDVWQIDGRAVQWRKAARERARPTSNWQFAHAVYGRGEKGDDDADEDQVEEEDEKKEARWVKQRSTERGSPCTVL